MGHKTQYESLGQIYMCTLVHGMNTTCTCTYMYMNTTVAKLVCLNLLYILTTSGTYNNLVRHVHVC